MTSCSWSVSPASGSAFDAAVRSGRVLVRAGTRWSAYDVADGKPLWQRTVPDRPQFLPYGFELESVPLFDADHALIGSTTALQTLDLADGSMTPAALPTDGINTTYWPYQLAVSDGLIAVGRTAVPLLLYRDDPAAAREDWEDLAERHLYGGPAAVQQDKRNAVPATMHFVVHLDAVD